MSHGCDIGPPPGTGQVILIDRAEHHLFRPLLYQCSTDIPVLRRERTFNIDDMPISAGAYGDVAEPGH